MHWMLPSTSEFSADESALDWEVVNGLMEDAIYGGRIDNAYDIRVLRAYLRYDKSFCTDLPCFDAHNYLLHEL